MRIWLVIALSFTCAASWAQMVEVSDDQQEAPPLSQPTTGKKRAAEYFKHRKSSSSGPAAPAAPADSGGQVYYPRYLAIHVGSFFSNSGYKWGKGDQDDIGKLNAGVTYRLGEWVNSMDLALRVDYTNYDLDEGDARKLGFGAIITFPDANSQFPLYFGGGLGAGLFLKQISGESVVALDYSLLIGVRVQNLIDRVGFLFETGIKNHLFLLSDGQFNGVFFNIGTCFNF